MLRFLKWFFLTLILIIGIGIALILTQQERIISLTVEALNKRLTAPIEVAEVRISFDHFPATAVALEGVFTPGHRASAGDTLLAMKEVFLDLDLWQLLQGEVAINRLRLKGGYLNIYRSSAYNNYDIWQSSDSSSSAVIALNDLLLEAVELRFRDKELAFQTTAFLEEARVSNIHSPWTEALDLELKGQVGTLIYQQEGYLAQAIALKGAGSLAPSGEGYALESSQLMLGGELPLQVKWNNAYGFQDLLIRGDQLPLKQIFAQLKEQRYYEQGLYGLDGRASISYQYLDGPEKINRFLFETSNGRLSRGDTVLLDDCEVAGRYDYAPQQDRLEIKHWRWQAAEEQLSLQGKITNLSQPLVQWQGQARLSLARWEQLLPGQLIHKPEGMIALDCQFQGRFKDLGAIAPQELSDAQLSGSAQLEGLAFTVPGTGRRVTRLNGAFKLAENQMKIERLFFATGQSDIYLQGTFGNVMNYLLLPDQKLAVRTAVKAQKIVLDEFVPESDGQEDNSAPLAFTRNLNLDLRLNIDQLQFRSFQAKQAQGKLRIANGQIIGEQIALNADDGQYRGDFQLNLPPAGPYKLQAQLSAADVDLNSVFASFENFGQTALTANNLSGRAGTRTRLSLEMDPQLNFDPSSLVLVADLEIKEGRLVNYEPMRALSRFAEVEELADVKFATLRNTVSIEKEVITIPDMAIHSNVMDMELNGQHDFDNNIHYVVRLAMSDVLFKKRQADKKESEFDQHLETVASEDEPIIPVTIKGSLSEPEITIESKEVGRSISSDLKKQGEALKKIFKKETPMEQKGTGIIFEWDDD